MTALRSPFIALICFTVMAVTACSNESEKNADITIKDETMNDNKEQPQNTDSTPTQAAETKQEQEVTLTGSIFYKNMEGGFYGFVAKNGDKYTLHGLNEAFQKNGLIVNVTGIPKPNLMTITQFGTVLQVKQVEVLDASKIIGDTSSH